MAKKKLIPFGWLPAHWGLSGKTRKLAEAEYYMEDGEEIERQKLEINLSEKDDDEIQLEGLKLDKKYGYLSEEEYERKCVDITIKDKKDKDVALLDIDKKYGKLTDAEYDKAKAGVLEEPYICVRKIETDPSNPAFGGVILDWNKAFVLHLEDHGYGPHPSDEETVNEWFNELCKNVALEAFDGLGDFAERVGQQRQRRTSMSDDVILRGWNDEESNAPK